VGWGVGLKSGGGVRTGDFFLVVRRGQASGVRTGRPALS